MKRKTVQDIIRILRDTFPKAKFIFGYRNKKTECSRVHWWARTSTMSASILRKLEEIKAKFVIVERSFCEIEKLPPNRAASTMFEGMKRIHSMVIELNAPSISKVV